MWEIYKESDISMRVQQLELEDQDQIDVMLEQHGGL